MAAARHALSGLGMVLRWRVSRRLLVQRNGAVPSNRPYYVYHATWFWSRGAPAAGVTGDPQRAAPEMACAP